MTTPLTTSSICSRYSRAPRGSTTAEPTGPGLQPLALLLAEAAATDDAQERNLVLQRVGDTSLFVAGFLGDGFARKLVDVDYYIDIGGAAYGSLSANVRGTMRGRAFGERVRRARREVSRVRRRARRDSRLGSR